VSWSPCGVAPAGGVCGSAAGARGTKAASALRCLLFLSSRQTDTHSHSPALLEGVELLLLGLELLLLLAQQLEGDGVLIARGAHLGGDAA
jgi:hypothetical protein